MTPSLPVTRLASCPRSEREPRRAAAARRSRRRVACLLAVLAASGLIVNQAAAQDTTAPVVTDISLSSFPPSDATYQRGDTIEVRVDFDVPVAVTGTSQVGVAIGSQPRAASLSRFAGTRSRAWTLFFQYQVQSTDSDTDGVSIKADAIGLNGGTIEDADDDTVDAVLTHAAVADDTDHKVDGSRFDVPSVNAISFVGSPANGDTYQLGETIEVKVEFDRFVEKTGRPRLQVALTIGTETRLADYDHGRGRGGGITDLYFEYEVQAGDRDTDGISIAADAIRLNGAGLKAAADGTTDADLTHAAVADDTSRKVAGSAVTAPAVNDIHFVGYPASGNSYQTDETITVRVFFDRSVNVTGSPQLELTIGGNFRLATSSSSQDRVGVAGLQFEYTVRAFDRDPDGISIAANAVRLNGGTITATDGTTDADLQHAALAADPRRTVGVSQVTGPLVTFVYFSSSAASGEYYQHGETIEVTVRFGEAVTVTGSPRVALTVGSHTRHATYSAADSSATEIAFGYTVQASDRDLDGVGIPANAVTLNGGTIKDADGTTDAVLTHTALAASSRRKVDGKTTAPIVSSISFTGAPAAGDTYVRSETIAVRVEFDRPVTVTGSPQVALAIGSHSRAAAFSSISLGVTALFTYTVQQDDLDAGGIGIAAGALSRNGATIEAAADGTTDAVLTHAAVAAAANRKVDGSRVVAPAVTGVSFAGAAPGGGSYRSGQTIWVEVEFSRPVTVTGSPLVDLDIGAHTRSASFFSVTANGTTAQFDYTVQAADADTDGISIAADAIRLDGGTIEGADGVTDAVLTHAAVAADPRRRVGGAAPGAGPAVSRLFFSSYPAGGDTYQFGEAIRVEVVFDRAVTVSGSPQLALTIGSATRAAGFVAGSDTTVTTLSFEYVVQAADRDADGIGIAANALALNSGAITAADGSGAADLTHAALAADRNRKVDGGLVSAPAVSSIYFSSTPANGTTYELGETTRVTVQFDRAVTATGNPQVALAIGTRSRLANYRTSHARFLFFDYPVQADDLDSDGIGIAANSIRLNGGTIEAAAADATAAELTHGAVSASHGVDGSRVAAPAVSHVAFSGSPVNGDTYLRGETIQVRVVFDRTVAVTGSPQVELTVGSRARAATYSSGTRSLTFAYPVQAGDRDADGVSIAADAIRLNGGAITAVDGTTAAGLAHLRVAASFARKVDGSRSRGPTVSAIAFSGRPAGGDTYELGETIAVQVDFDTPVTVAGAPRVQVTVGSRTRHAAFSSASRAAVTTLSFEYTVQADDRDADGIGIPANAILLDGGSITDSARAGIVAILGHAPVPADGTRKVDGSRVTTPAVSAISFAGRPAGGDTYVRGETIRVAVAFDRRVTVSGSPQVALLIDSGSRSARFASAGAGGTALDFEYTVQAQDLDPDGIAIAADAIALNGGTIRAADGVTDAELAHAALAADATRKVDGRIAGPVVSSISFTGAPLAGGTYQRGENIDVRVEFSQPIAYTGRPYVELSIGSRTRPAAFAFVPGPAALAFKYVVVAGDLDPDGVAIAADAIRLDGGSIKAADGVTPAILGHAAVAADPNRRVDGNQATAPAVSAVSFVDSPANGDTYQLGETIEVKLVFDRYVAFSGSPRVALTIGGQTRLARLSYGRGTGGITDLHFKYVVQQRDFDADGIGIAANAIRLDGGSITARDGITDADLRHAALADDATRRVDGIAVTGPALDRIAFSGVPAGGDAYQRGETIKVQVGFDRLVTVAGSPEVELTIGRRTARAVLSSHGVGVRALGFGYPVQALDSDADGIAIAANAIRLNGGSITATDGTTPALLPHAAVADDLSRKVGAVTETAAETALRSIFFSSSPAGGDTYERGETIEVRAVFNRSVRVAGSPRVELAIGTDTRAATFSGTHYGRTLVFRYRVQAVDRDADGIGLAAGRHPPRRRQHQGGRQHHRRRADPCRGGGGTGPQGGRQPVYSARGDRSVHHLAAARRHQLRARRGDRAGGRVQRAGNRNRCAGAGPHRGRRGAQRGLRALRRAQPVVPLPGTGRRPRRRRLRHRRRRAHPERRQHQGPDRKRRPVGSRRQCRRQRRRTSGRRLARGHGRARGDRCRGDLRAPAGRHLRARRDAGDRGPLQRTGDRDRRTAADPDARQRPAPRGLRLGAAADGPLPLRGAGRRQRRARRRDGRPQSERRHHSRRRRQCRRAESRRLGPGARLRRQRRAPRRGAAHGQQRPVRVAAGERRRLRARRERAGGGPLQRAGHGNRHAATGARRGQRDPRGRVRLLRAGVRALPLPRAGAGPRRRRDRRRRRRHHPERRHHRGWRGQPGRIEPGGGRNRIGPPGGRRRDDGYRADPRRGHLRAAQRRHLRARRERRRGGGVQQGSDGQRPAAAGADDRLGYGARRGPRRPPGRGPGRHRRAGNALRRLRGRRQRTAPLPLRGAGGRSFPRRQDHHRRRRAAAQRRQHHRRRRRAGGRGKPAAGPRRGGPRRHAGRRHERTRAPGAGGGYLRSAGRPHLPGRRRHRDRGSLQPRRCGRRRTATGAGDRRRRRPGAARELRLRARRHHPLPLHGAAGRSRRRRHRHTRQRAATRRRDHRRRARRGGGARAGAGAAHPPRRQGGRGGRGRHAAGGALRDHRVAAGGGRLRIRRPGLGAGRVQRAGGGYRQSATGAGRRQRQPRGRHRARNRAGARRARVRLHGAGG